MDLPARATSQKAMSRHEMFPDVSRPERGVSAHALDAANVLVISIRWTSQELFAIAKLRFSSLVPSILLLWQE